MLQANTGARCIKLFLFILFAVCQINGFAQSTPLPNGFAHNDYCHKHPLFDALDNGFTNIEADIFLKEDRLVVAHVFPFFKHNRTLETLYLKPLLARINQNNGKVYSNYNSPVILMIDIKTGANNTYEALKPILEKYKSILSGLENGKMVNRAVTVVLSGHKPYKSIENEKSRLAFIDEDLRKVQRDSTFNNVFSLASCKYSNFLKWNGNGTIPSAEKNKLCAYVVMAHRMGTKVRLWASPEKKAVWDTLLQCGVDLINTDQLVTLKNYLNANVVALARAN
ncbi:MAG: phosphatidylinositol-specific phospholipase C/glycerophosphodiester phosphodiesterase family protein [Mucilaginibacter sp.]